MAIKKEYNKLAKKRLLIESLIAFLIVLAPFIFKIYEYFPEDDSIETVSVLWFEVGKNGWPNIAGHIWFLFGKIVPLYLLFIWFLTCKHWWYHIILIPVIMYSFQIFEDVFDDDGVVDTENLMWLLPICVVIIPFVYFIRVKLYDKHVHGIDLDAMDEELTILKAKEELRKEREKLEQRQRTLEKKM